MNGTDYFFDDFFQKIALGSLWTDQTCVVFFMRRFGWMFCRLAAQEISLLSPVLSQANVKLIGVGLEPLGVEEFVEQKFWAGGKLLHSYFCFKL